MSEWIGALCHDARLLEMRPDLTRRRLRLQAEGEDAATRQWPKPARVESACVRMRARSQDHRALCPSPSCPAPSPQTGFHANLLAVPAVGHRQSHSEIRRAPSLGHAIVLRSPTRWIRNTPGTLCREWNPAPYRLCLCVVRWIASRFRTVDHRHLLPLLLPLFQ